MTAKTVLITGGTGGIGRATAIGLASMGAHIGVVGRDQTRTEKAAGEISAASGNPAIGAFAADMSSQADVRRLANEVLAAYPRLDVLVNNVGGFWANGHLTTDGLEHAFALNQLAPFLLTNLLLERLVASGGPARVVTVSSAAHKMGTINFVVQVHVGPHHTRSAKTLADRAFRCPHQSFLKVGIRLAGSCHSVCSTLLTTSASGGYHRRISRKYQAHPRILVYPMRAFRLMCRPPACDRVATSPRTGNVRGKVAITV